MCIEAWIWNCSYIKIRRIRVARKMLRKAFLEITVIKLTQILPTPPLSNFIKYPIMGLFHSNFKVNKSNFPEEMIKKMKYFLKIIKSTNIILTRPWLWFNDCTWYIPASVTLRLVISSLCAVILFFPLNIQEILGAGNP